MEVGAVKQAFNNEVILLKKKLNQAKIQIIHKLTRRAKTLTEKKAPDHFKEKLNRKAESAVNEVLIIKKIKARDIAKFIITHTGKVNDYLNKPKVDTDKACARLVLHKALQDKYKFIRNRFGNIPIKDLFMSRQERRKLKKEEKEQQKNKKKVKSKTNKAGDFSVEDMAVGNNKNDDVEENGDVGEISGDKSQNSFDGNDDLGDENDKSDGGFPPFGKGSENSGDEMDSDDGEMERNDDSADESENDDDGQNSESESEEESKLIKLQTEKKVISKEKLKPAISKVTKPEVPPVDIETLKTIPKLETSEIDKIITEIQIKKHVKKQTDKKVKENKNKNLRVKIENRKFKKDEESHVKGKKVVDPFFITASGENYLSVAEPRLPDEVKEVHKQGNRQERRAAMFGRKYKPKSNFEQNSFRSSKFDNNNEDRKSGFGNRNDRFTNRNERFNDRNDKFNERNSKFNDKNDRFNNKNFNNIRKEDKKEEKLHPSWEAKRKLKSMPLLPSQGKKIVFDE